VKKLLKQDEDTGKIPILLDTGKIPTFKIPILTATNCILLLYDSSQNRDLKCNRIHYQYLHLV